MNRAELARQAWAILLASPGLRHDYEPEYVADCAVKSADALLAALITPETVVGSQQVIAGLSVKQFRMRQSCKGVTHGKVYAGVMKGQEFIFSDDEGDTRLWNVNAHTMEEIPNA